MPRKQTVADPRPDWDTYFMEIARETATRAN
jgi:deoxycytidylate deaminase